MTERAIPLRQGSGAVLLPRSLSTLTSALGNRRVARLVAEAGIQRQVAPPGAGARDFVRATIEYLARAGAFFSLARLDAARFERVVNSWYLMVIDRERTINTQLGGDAGLTAGLRAAYTAALRALMIRATSDLRRSEADLYRENRGRIPMWAWQTPHRMEPRISTPLPQGWVRQPQTGRVTSAINGFNLTIFPDAVDRGLGARGETRVRFRWGRISWRTKAGRITRVSGPGTPVVHIRTRYGPQADPGGRSGYGRGTTPQDIAGGRVTPTSTTLRFHEGSHGLDFVEFLSSNPPPRFTGAVGMTASEFRAARTEWREATTQYANGINAFSTRHTDCVGTTIDDFRSARARAGQRIVLECGP